MSNSSQTDWDALAKMSDEEIDYSDIPALDDKFFDDAGVRIPLSNAKSLVMLDPDVLAWFQAKGPGFQTLVNSALRSYMAEANR